MRSARQRIEHSTAHIDELLDERWDAPAKCSACISSVRIDEVAHQRRVRALVSVDCSGYDQLIIGEKY